VTEQPMTNAANHFSYLCGILKVAKDRKLLPFHQLVDVNGWRVLTQVMPAIQKRVQGLLA
jgi:hypothetical protein